MRVDLPAPLCPTSAWTSPRRTSKSTPASACTPGKLLVMPRIASNVSAAMIVLAHRGAGGPRPSGSPLFLPTSALYATKAGAQEAHGVGLDVGVVLDRDVQRNLLAREVLIDRAEGDRAKVRVGLHADREDSLPYVVDSPLPSVNGADVDVLGESGLAHGLVGAHGHCVVVRVNHIDLRAELGDPVGRDRLGLIQHEVAVLRIQHVETLDGVDHLVETVVAVDGRSGTSGAAQLHVVDGPVRVLYHPLGHLHPLGEEVGLDGADVVDAGFARAGAVDLDDRDTRGTSLIGS